MVTATRGSKGEAFEYGEEHVVQTTSGVQIRTSAYPTDCDYIRVLCPHGEEIAYWSVDEWTESTAQGMEVMGAIFGAASDGKAKTCSACKQQSRR
jgi:hypothetical protein